MNYYILLSFIYPLKKQAILILLVAIEAKGKTKYHLYALLDPMI